jgi:N-acetylglutamate synthase/N-acetylornithine aminotransferase
MKRSIRTASKGLLAVVLSLALISTGCSAAWLNTAIADVPVILQIVTSIISIVGIAQGNGGISPAMAATLQSGAKQATTDLQLVQKLVTDYQTASAANKPTVLGQIDSALSAATQDLGAILTAAHIENQATQAAITAAVGLALTTVLAIQSLIPAPQGATAARGRMSASPVKPLTPAQLKTNFNAIVRANGYGQVAIQ